MTRIGAITVGQSPRVDVTPDIAPLLPDVEIVERGALDGLSDAELEALTARRHDPVLATRRRDGREIIVAEDDVMPGLRSGIAELEGAGVEALMLLCTGTFPALDARVPLLYPERLLSHFVAAAFGGHVLGVMTPAAAQIPFQRERWAKVAGDEACVKVAHASPYAGHPVDNVARAARDLAGEGAQVIVMDCLGYSRAMRRQVREVASRPVVLARTVLARAAGELLGV